MATLLFPKLFPNGDPTIIRAVLETSLCINYS